MWARMRIGFVDVPSSEEESQGDDDLVRPEGGDCGRGDVIVNGIVDFGAM